MSLISEKFADELAEKPMRDAYLGTQTCAKIVEQIRTMRAQRGLSQAEFAKCIDKPPSNVSQRLENREYSGFTVKTLLKVASAYDVGLVIEFVPYEEFLERTSDFSRKALEVRSFSRAALNPLCQDSVTSNQSAGVVVTTDGALTNRIFETQTGITASGGVDMFTASNFGTLQILTPCSLWSESFNSSVQDVMKGTEKDSSYERLHHGSSHADPQALTSGLVA